MNSEFKEKFRLEELELLNFDYWMVSVRPKQPTIGSLVISLKRDCKNVGDLKREESEQLAFVFSKVESLLKSVFSYDKINYLCLMMVDEHVHFHAIPRYKSAIEFKEETYTDPSWPGAIDISKIIDKVDIEIEVYEYLKKKLAKQNKGIGYTTGVYDLFHVGHLNILKKAKSECNYLIVGVTTDELSLKRKNKTPIIPLEERMEIIKNFSFVDKVVVQDNMDKFAAWEKYQFDKMFVGDDWKGSEKWNKLEEQFAEVNVEIVYFPYTKSTSSTKIRELVKKKDSLN